MPGPPARPAGDRHGRGGRAARGARIPRRPIGVIGAVVGLALRALLEVFPLSPAISGSFAAGRLARMALPVATEQPCHPPDGGSQHGVAGILGGSMVAVVA